MKPTTTSFRNWTTPSTTSQCSQ